MFHWSETVRVWFVEQYLKTETSSESGAINDMNHEKVPEHQIVLRG